MRRLETVGVVLGVLLAVVLPVLTHGPPTTPRGVVGVLLLVGAGLSLAWWRTAPRVASSASLGLLLLSWFVDGGAWFPETAIIILSLGFAVLALGWSGRAAWAVGVLAVGYLAVVYAIGATGSEVALVMFTVPGFVAGSIFRLRRETAEALALRAEELEREQEELARLSVRQERQRIAGELHDVVGHALSVLVIQAAAGQRLVDTAPERVDGTLGVIAESARRGTADLERLVDLLGGTPMDPDLGLVDDVVAHAVRSGLDVTYRVEGDRTAVTDRAAHLVHRVVQEGLTNARRYAPGAAVRIRIGPDPAEEAGAGLAVTVENDPAADVGTLRGTGYGLAGLRERVQAQGGRFRAGPTARGGWSVEVWLPLRPAS